VPVPRCRATTSEKSTLEREYVHILMQDLVNGGHFPPHDAFWASRQIPRWSKALSLETRAGPANTQRFVVDLDGARGMVRLSIESANRSLYLDVAPVLDSIRNEIKTLRDAPRPEGNALPRGRGRELKLLRKLSTLYSPMPLVVRRRGERKPVAATVEAVTGLTQILRALRNKAPRGIPAPSAAVPEIEEITITVFGGFTQVPSGVFPEAGTAAAPRSTDEVLADHQMWKLLDRSDSGCRLQGQTFGSNRVTPGALIAFREQSTIPWSLAIVRRVEKLAGNRVDIGVEFVGKNPRGVVVAAGFENPEQPTFAAIYLPESDQHPVMPIRTLVLPARTFGHEARLSLRSATANYTIQLKEPIEEQGDFVWSPFEVVERCSLAEPA
jgi:hypothetical protein